VDAIRLHPLFMHLAYLLGGWAVELMSFLSWLVTMLGKFFKEILPGLIKAGKKPREVKPAGFDKELKEDMDSSIENDINEMSNDRNPDGN